MRQGVRFAALVTAAAVAALPTVAQDIDLSDPGILTLPLDQLPSGPNDPQPSVEDQLRDLPQDLADEPSELEDPFADEPRARIPEEPPANAVQVIPGTMVEAPKARLRGLDKLTNTVNDFEIEVGQTLAFKRLIVTLEACRYPQGEITEEAYAFLRIRDQREDDERFAGWMLASSPALSALDHPRYDVWVLSCSTS
ncbi:DUF2155 domain-containing protein [Halovulum sp. GXIMD14794]